MLGSGPGGPASPASPTSPGRPLGPWSAATSGPRAGPGQCGVDLGGVQLNTDDPPRTVSLPLEDDDDDDSDAVVQVVDKPRGEQYRVFFSAPRALPLPRRRNVHVDDDAPSDSPREARRRVRPVFHIDDISSSSAGTNSTASRVSRALPTAPCRAARGAPPTASSDPANYRPQAHPKAGAQPASAALGPSLRPCATLPAKLPCCCGLDAGGSPNGFITGMTPSPGGGPPPGSVPPEQQRPGWTRTRAERTRRRQRRLSSNLQAHKEALANNNDIPQDGKIISNLAQMSGEKREHLYKILVIGELGTGKTSIIKRYVHQFFSQHYRATIGVDFALKVLNWDPATIIRLQLWDIAGQERFGNMTRVYYKEAVGAFIVFDVTRASTFDAVVKWKQDLDSKVQMADGSPIPCVLLANKCDQQKEGLVNNPPKMDEYCKEKGFTGWFETSAKENVNIEEAARALVSKILLNDKLLHGNDTKDPTKIALDPNGKANGEPPNGKSCAC
ncbi:uncharacterized protein LOC113210492 isoform X8 [Frankliniella occidentalis]|uniref:Uncharacterized protein LOC113210492 isoform X8 n=1 Tax=Frankliniella occidentalis TaxID=133901 RepID=A0A6J1STV2_FRAOC|nr:uncharacterized protein LOC113210492 isoform X9 [Frankliniella occidentalis]XP_052120793.1 uncharacterized protein LOC113210492 isoform X8 [Frankliniella occidentalis]